MPKQLHFWDLLFLKVRFTWIPTRWRLNFSAVAAPIIALTKKEWSSPFAWNSEADKAFEELKKRFISKPVLVNPNPSLPFVVEVDGSDVGVGAILSQHSQNYNSVHHCAYFSRLLSPAERNDDVGDQERLAIKLALEEWRHWLEGAEQPFVVWTDHKNLLYIQQTKRHNARQARWSMFFNRFNYTLTYQPGSKNIKPDALSRMYDHLDSEAVPELIVSMNRIVAPLLWDIETVVQSALATDPSPGGGPLNCLFVPVRVRSHVLQWAHSSKLAGHPGVQRTMEFLSRCFWWPGLNRDVQKCVAACSVCSRNKNSHFPPSGLLRPLPIPKCPWRHMALDFITGLPVSDGLSVILVMVDRFSKVAHFVVLAITAVCAGVCTANDQSCF